MKELMIHVERIVRPIRATDHRKLHMRRELLAHLQAALEEEHGHSQNEAAAWDAAKRRLGDPAQLTRTLQQSVPILERTLLGHIPATRWMKRCEKKMGDQMGLGGKTLGQQGLFTLGAMILTYGSMLILAFRFKSQHGEQMMRALSERGWHYQVGNITAGGLLLVVMGACFAIVGTAAKRKGLRQIVWYGAWAIGSILAWMTTLVTIVVQQQVQISELAWGAFIGILLVAGLAGLGHLTAKIGWNHEEWLSLDLADHEQTDAGAVDG